MAGYIYLPKANKEMKDMANDWGKGRKAKGKTPYQTITPNICFNGSILKKINPQDKLYVLMHGGGLMSSKIGAGGLTFTPKELATHLNERGLKKTARDIRIFACGSGGHGNAIGQGGSRYIPPFVKVLRDELGNLEYHHVAVYGYIASVYTAYNEMIDSNGNKGSFKTLQNPNGDGGLIRASEGRVVFYGNLRTEQDSQLPPQHDTYV